ncbi:hypothetical protein L6R50_08915 [Myxococcota bacterium]|nr:hypothetical protein [Myxococcota bacterium]
MHTVSNAVPLPSPASGPPPWLVTLAYMAAGITLGMLLVHLATGCASSTPAPAPSVGSPDSGEVEGAFNIAALAATVAQTAALADASAEGCLAASIAYGGIQLAHTVYHGVASGGGALVLAVDASACLPLGLPAVSAPPPEVDSGIRLVLQIVGDAVGLLGTVVTDDDAKAVLARVGEVLALVPDAYSATVEALRDEASQPDGKVTIILAEEVPIAASGAGAP